MTAPGGGLRERRLLELLGLAARAGALLSGTANVREGVRDGRVHFVMLAEDAAAGQRGKLEPLLQARGVSMVSRFSRARLGAALGAAPVSAVGIADPGLAERAAELARGSVV